MNKIASNRAVPAQTSPTGTKMPARLYGGGMPQGNGMQFAVSPGAPPSGLPGLGVTPESQYALGGGAPVASLGGRRYAPPGLLDAPQAPAQAPAAASPFAGHDVAPWLQAIIGRNNPDMLAAMAARQAPAQAAPIPQDDWGGSPVRMYGGY